MFIVFLAIALIIDTRQPMRLYTPQASEKSQYPNNQVAGSMIEQFSTSVSSAQIKIGQDDESSGSATLNQNEPAFEKQTGPGNSTPNSGNESSNSENKEGVNSNNETPVTTASPTPNQPVDSVSGQDSCVASGGRWNTFPNGCADTCAYAENPLLMCTQVITDACDCGPDACWSGSSCVTNPIQGLKPVCGNDICEPGEADQYIPGGCNLDNMDSNNNANGLTIEPPECLGLPDKFIPGTCNQDCS